MSDLLPPGIDPNTPKITIRAVSGHNDGATRTEIRVRDLPPFATDEPKEAGGTDTGPTPLETTLAALVGCEGVIIHRCATIMGFKYSGVDFACKGQMDARGPRGVKGVRPFFESVDLTVTLHTDEPPEQVAKLKRNVEHRCPVMNLLRSANVAVTADWVTVPAEK